MSAPNSPAFPCPGAEGVNPESLGMSLRVYAAIEAMKALIITLRPEVDEMGRILPSQWRPIVSGSYKLADEMIREGVAALTPAPTQEPPAEEPKCNCADWGMMDHTSDCPLGIFIRAKYSKATPPAGGVTISTEKKGGEAGMFIESPPMKGASDVRPEGRPADVPPEGRGELLPFNLADALAGKPLITRDGLKATEFQLGPPASSDVYQYIARIDDLTWSSYTAEGKWLPPGDEALDLFMLPPEGSGA